VCSIIEGAVAIHQPDEFHVTKVDHWFDHKWKGFSGKVLGALGVWHRPVTVPPFVQNRIVEQRRFERRGDSKGYVLATSAPEIHHHGRSEDNLHRPARRVAPHTALFWYSGDTQSTGRGSLMGYIPVEGDYWTWYLAFRRDEEWRVLHRNGIQEYEVRMLRDRGLAEATESCDQV
jgi:hypothetical protein